MLANETTNQKPQSNAGYWKRALIVVIARDAFLVECIAAVLGRYHSDYEVCVIDRLDALDDSASDRVRLVLFRHEGCNNDTNEISAVADALEGKAIGVIVDNTDTLDGTLLRSAEAQRIAGILPLKSGLDVFLAGVDLLLKGGEHFPSAVFRRQDPKNEATIEPATQPMADGTTDADCTETLTTREHQILHHLCKGTQNKMIAYRLALSENTIKVHIRNIYRKLGVHNRTEAVLRLFPGRPEPGHGIP